MIDIETSKILEILTKELGIKGTEKGKSFFFICPFHDDKTPSLSFEMNSKFFNCFSCEFKARDVFVFWSKYKQITLEETLEQLSDLGYIPKREKLKKIITINEEDRILSIIDIVCKIYQNNLLSENGKRSFEYLKEKRRVNDELIEKFQIGTAINSKQLSNLLLKENSQYSVTDTFKTSLFQLHNENQYNDFFYGNSIIFPLKDEKGSTVSFAARTTDKSSESRYLFLPSNKLTSKSSIIYNYNNVKNQSEEICYLVEGFFDVISLTKVEINSCVSLLGTSISTEQIKLLKKLKKRIIIFFDGDQAGIEASVKVGTTLMLNEIDCEIIENQTGMDPDEIINSNKKELNETIKKRRSPLPFILSYYYKKLNINDNPQRINYYIEKISDIFHQFGQNYQNLIVNRLSSMTGLDYQKTEKIYKKYDGQGEFKVKKLTYNEEINKLEKEIIYQACKDRLTWSLIENENFNFTTPSNLNHYQKISRYYLSNLLSESYKQSEGEEWFLELSQSNKNNPEKDTNIDKLLKRINLIKNES